MYLDNMSQSENDELYKEIVNRWFMTGLDQTYAIGNNKVFTKHQDKPTKSMCLSARIDNIEYDFMYSELIQADTPEPIVIWSNSIDLTSTQQKNINEILSKIMLIMQFGYLHL